MVQHRQLDGFANGDKCGSVNRHRAEDNAPSPETVCRQEGKEAPEMCNSRM
jgi:hypothetical protein